MRLFPDRCKRPGRRLLIVIAAAALGGASIFYASLRYLQGRYASTFSPVRPSSILETEKPTIQALDGVRADVNWPPDLPECPVFELAEGRYDYSGRWNGLDVANISIAFQRTQAEWRLFMRTVPKEGLEGVYALRYQYESRVHGVDYRPIEAYLQERNGDRKKRTRLGFADRSARVIVYKRRSGGSSRRIVSKFVDAERLCEPFSLLLALLAHEWQAERRAAFCLLLGDRRYEIVVESKGDQSLPLASGGEVLATELQVASRRIRREEKADKENDPVMFSLFLSKAPDRRLLKIESVSAVGLFEVVLDASGADPGD